MSRFVELDNPNGARLIPLTRGLIAVVDETDYERLSEMNWVACSNQYGSFYAVTNQRRPDGSFGSVRMHRLLLEPPDGLVVDHMNGVTLDNRRSNLRLATLNQNAMHAKKSARATSHFKGVSKRSYGGPNPWEAGIQVNKQPYHLGSFPTEEAAARARDAAAIRLHGPFAWLNFPLETYT